MVQWPNRCILVVTVVLSARGLPAAGPTGETGTPAATVEFDGDALAARAEFVIARIREHHIDPPSAGEMWLGGVRTLKRFALQEQQQEFAFRQQQRQQPSELRAAAASELETAESRRDFLNRVWSREISPFLSSRNLPGRDLLRAFVQGLLPEGADLVPANEYKIEERVRGNRYSGTGIALNFDKASGYPQIAGVIPGGPMERAGGASKDLIVAIDGRDTKGWTISQVREVLSGDEGTTVTVELKAKADATGRTIPITRGIILFKTLNGVPGREPGGRVLPGSPIRYVGFNQFNGSTVHDLTRLEKTIRSEGAGAVILDFRSTEGHDLHVALLLADALMDGGTIGRLRSRTHVQEFRADRDRLFRDMPIAVLVDEETEGIGEWVAAALQDQKATTIIGATTHGALLVRTHVLLPETNEYLELATARFERPGTNIDPNSQAGRAAITSGVVPDLITENAREIPKAQGRIRKPARSAATTPDESEGTDPDPALTAAIQRLTRQMEGRTGNSGQ